MNNAFIINLEIRFSENHEEGDVFNKNGSLIDLVIAIVDLSYRFFKDQKMMARIDRASNFTERQAP